MPKFHQILFNYFKNKTNPKSIISYCDLSKFSGEVYEKLGFIYMEGMEGRNNMARVLISMPEEFLSRIK